MDRKEILLRAAYDLLMKMDALGSDALALTVHYDDADCDGMCLLDDITVELGIHSEDE